MPPRSQHLTASTSTAGRRGGNAQAKSSARLALDAALSPENRTVLTAVGCFAAGIAFLHSGWGEILLPPSI